jgi:hypothetical protein
MPMVFESILGPSTAEKKPLDAFLLSFVLTTMAILLSLIVFTPYGGINFLIGAYIIFFLFFLILITETHWSLPKGTIYFLILAGGTYFFVNLLTFLWARATIDYTSFGTHVSLSVVFFTALGLAPLMLRLLQIEEKKDITLLESQFLQRHAGVLKAYTALFIGGLLAFSFWFTILPEAIADSIFFEQLGVLRAINNIRADEPTGMAVSAFGVAQVRAFNLIVFNNLKVLAISTLLSFCLGSGAIFILTWNASVIATAIGTLARSLTQSYLALGPAAPVIAYLHAVPIAFSQLIFHGAPEIIAYFIGGLAGGILSVAAVSHEGDAVWVVVLDAVKMLFVAVVFIIVAAFIEIQLL